MEYQKALQIAEKVKQQLEPYCDRIEIAGSIRRKKPQVKDIEVVAIPNDRFQLGMIVNKWKKIRGDISGKYLQRTLPEGINLDLFFATERNWGYIFSIRTGNAEFSRQILANGWVKAGFTGKEGMLIKNSQEQEIREEIDLFNLIGIDFVPPEQRELK